MRDRPAVCVWMAMIPAMLLLSSVARADDDDDRRVERLPDAVYDVLVERFPGCNILQAEIDDDDDRDDQRFEVWLKHKGRLYEVEVENGKIADIDREDDDHIKDTYDDEAHRG